MNNISKIENKIISINDTIISALKQMDGHRTKLVFVFDEDKFEGILTIGDIQRAIISQANLSDSVSTILVKDKIYASENDSQEQIKSVMFEELIDCMPVRLSMCCFGMMSSPRRLRRTVLRLTFLWLLWQVAREHV